MNTQAMLLYRLDRSPLGELFQGNNADSASPIGKLIEFGCRLHVRSNLWHYAIAYAAAFDTNAFSLACEMRPMLPSGSLCKLAVCDFVRLRELFRMDLQEAFGISAQYARELESFDAPALDDAPYDAALAHAIEEFTADLESCTDAEEMMRAAAAFYGKYGVGELGLYKAFRIRQQEGAQARDKYTAAIRPISNPDERRLSDIIGYDLQKSRVVANTEAFLEGRPANNVLLYGDGGTGKSSTIKALLNEYYPRGLRIVELYKHQFGSISDLIGQIKNRNYRFILYLDDLSFEDFETEYKYFKAIIEGGMESRPTNVLIYATSNRRHLIKESFSDKNDMQTIDDLHRSDTIQEKLSLAARFGLSVFYPSPNQIEYLRIVRELAQKHNVDLPQEELERRALQWEIRGNGKSGRAAQQFIDSIL